TGLSVFMALIFVQLVVVMPRSGGDYVFTSRIMHPFLGWIETWTLIWANLAIIGYELLWIRLGLGGFFSTMGAIFPGGGWTTLGIWLTVTPITQIAFGGLLCLLIGLMALLKPRTFYTILSVLCVISLACVLIMAL